MIKYDVIIIGAGAAGLSAAATALSRGRRVAILEMGATSARKVMASGGGRCNITNLAATRDRYFGENPDFVRGALGRVSPHDILDWATTHGLSLIEREPGRFFCENGASAVVDALMSDARDADIFYNTPVSNVERTDGGFIVSGSGRQFRAESVIVATGGTSFATLGVSDVGFKIAKSFGHKIIPVRPALCALSVPYFSSEFSGIALPAEIKIGRATVRDSLLFTHFGIGGPAAYRTSLYDVSGGIEINLMPDNDVFEILTTIRRRAGRRTVAGALSEYLPTRIAKWVADEFDGLNIADLNDAKISTIADRVSKISIPGNQIKFHGLSSAEVIRGGIDTRDISSKTMESKLCPNIFFVGEVLDIAGDLGGFNLHWAWASGRVAGQNA